MLSSSISLCIFSMYPQLLFNLRSNRMVVNIFGEDDNSKGKDGKPGPAGVGGLTSIIKWFPFMALQQIRNHLNLATFKIDKSKSDVVLEDDDRVTKWKGVSREKKIALIPVDKKGTIARLGPDPSNANYGLVFDDKEKTMYYIEKCDREYLSLLGVNLLLTMTFLVGEYKQSNETTHSPPNSSNGPRPTKILKNNEGQDIIKPCSLSSETSPSNNSQFLINDYHYAKHETSYDKLRGVSILVKNEKQLFDLVLHGGFAEEEEKEEEEFNDFALTIARDLEMGKFYTLQICWNQSVGSYYSLYKDFSCLQHRVPFRNAPVRKNTKAALYVGGFNNSKTKGEVKKTQCFKGVISNIEILTTSDVVPNNLVEFISKKQFIYNLPEHISENLEMKNCQQSIDTSKSEIKAPVPKKIKRSHDSIVFV